MCVCVCVCTCACVWDFLTGLIRVSFVDFSSVSSKVYDLLVLTRLTRDLVSSKIRLQKSESRAYEWVQWVTHLHVCDVRLSCVWCDFLVRVTWLCIRVTWLIHMCHATHSYMCDMTHSCVWHDFMTWLIYVWHDSFMCVTWLHDMTHLCVTWLIYVCDMTHSYVWHDWFIHVIWRVHMCVMQHTATHCNTHTLPSVSVTGRSADVTKMTRSLWGMKPFVRRVCSLIIAFVPGVSTWFTKQYNMYIYIYWCICACIWWSPQ